MHNVDSRLKLNESMRVNNETQVKNLRGFGFTTKMNRSFIMSTVYGNV